MVMFWISFFIHWIAYYSKKCVYIDEKDITNAKIENIQYKNEIYLVYKLIFKTVEYNFCATYIWLSQKILN